MPEKIFGLTPGTFERVKRAVLGSERRLPDVGRRTRRVHPNTSRVRLSEACECSPFDCLSPGTAVGCYYTCQESAGTWRVDFGANQFAGCSGDAGGEHFLEYFTGCIWRGVDFDIDSFTTRWELDISEGRLTLVLNEDGDQICYELQSGDWCCLCANHLHICCGPHAECITGEEPWMVCVHPDSVEYGDIACGENEYPREFTATTFGLDPFPLTLQEDGTWTGTLIIPPSEGMAECCETSTIVVTCVEGVLVVSIIGCDVAISGTGELTGDGDPDYGTFEVVLDGVCIGGTIEFTVT